MTNASAVILPAEWAPQSGVMLTWPHPQTDWAPYLAEVEPVFIEIAKQVTLREPLLISAFDNTHLAHIQQQLEQAGVALQKITFYQVSSDDSWARDHGPITILVNGQPTLLDFTFNAWGDKFESNLDNLITGKLHELGAFGSTPRQVINMVLEGGGIESDGKDTLLTTSACLLSDTRNPEMDKQQIEKQLCELFGLKRVLWLDHGYLAGDDTDSHIDTLARFCNEETIIYVSCDDPEDEHYPALKAMEQQLQAMTTSAGNPYKLIPLPWPGVKYNEEGKKLPASYANFLIINGAVLAPTYDDPQDALALEQLKTGFPDKEIIGINCLPLIWQYGSLHCVTMQLPAGVLPQ